MIGTLTVDGCAVTFGTARAWAGCGPAQSPTLLLAVPTASVPTSVFLVSRCHIYVVFFVTLFTLPFGELSLVGLALDLQLVDLQLSVSDMTLLVKLCIYLLYIYYIIIILYYIIILLYLLYYIYLTRKIIPEMTYDDWDVKPYHDLSEVSPKFSCFKHCFPHCSSFHTFMKNSVIILVTLFYTFRPITLAR